MEEQNRNKETALGEARRPSSVEEAEAAIEAVLFAMGDSVELGRIAKAIGHDTETTRRRKNVNYGKGYQLRLSFCSERQR